MTNMKGDLRPPRGVAYYRKSNDDGGKSVGEQRDWALLACPREGIDLAEQFQDDAVAGHDTARRTEFHKMLEFCREQHRLKRPVEVVVCWHPNRFSRSDSHETSWYLWEFRKAGVRKMYTAARGWVDFSRSEDRMLGNIEQDATNHRYVVDLARDSTRGRLAGAREGRWQGGPVPYGYQPELERVTRKGRARFRTARLVPGPDDAVAVVKRIFREYATTVAGFRQIAAGLNAEGVAPPRGRAWATNTVRRILCNPAYLGRLVWGRLREGKFFCATPGKPGDEVTPVPAATAGRIVANPEEYWVGAAGRTHEPLIDEATWQCCRAKMGRRKTQGTPRVGCYALSGLVRCGHCGARMVPRVLMVRRPNGVTNSYRRVHCNGYNRSGKSVCSYNGLDADALTRAVLAKLKAGLQDPRFRKALRDEVQRQDAAAQTADPGRLADLKARLSELERKVQRAADLILDENDATLLPALRERLRQRQQERDTVAAEAEALERAVAPGVDAEAEADAALALADRLDETDGYELRDVLAEAVAYIELFFVQEPYGKARTRSRFTRGLVHVRPGLLADVLCDYSSVTIGKPP